MSDATHPDAPADAHAPASSPTSPTGPDQVDGKSFWALTATMFQGALSDNIYKFVLTIMAINLAMSRAVAPAGATDATAATKAGEALATQYQTFIGIAFALPWIIAFAFSGWLGDRFSKSRVTQGTKLLEIVIMLIAIVALQSGSLWFAIAVMFLMSLQSALFGPSKYGVLAEILPANKLGWGNGMIQGLTFVAILIGTLVGPRLYSDYSESLWVAGVILTVLACIGMGASMMMRPLPAANPTLPLQLNPFTVLFENGRTILSNAGITWCIAGQVIFWTVAVMLQSAVVLVAKQTMGLSDAQVGFALIPIAVGNGIGCFIVSYMCRNRNELGLVPFGALLMFLAGVVVYLLIPYSEQLKVYTPGQKEQLLLVLPIVLGFMGATCGMIVVPLEAYLVHNTDPKQRGGVLATTNLLIAFGWLVGAVLYGVCYSLRDHVGDVFLFCGVAILVTCIAMCYRFPRVPLRFMTLVLFSTFYRTRVKGVENIPAARRRAAGPESPVLPRRDPALLGHRGPPHPLHHEQGGVQHRGSSIPSPGITHSIPIEQNAVAARADRRAARGRRGDQGRRPGLHLPRGPAHAHGRADALPARPRAHHEGPRRADHPGGDRRRVRHGMALRNGRKHLGDSMPWRRLAINVVFGKALPTHTPLAVLRQNVVDLMVDAFRFPPRRRRAAAPHGGAEPARWALRDPLRGPHEREAGAEPPCAGRGDGAGDAAPRGVARGGERRHHAAAVDRRDGAEHRGAAGRQGAGEPELYGLAADQHGDLRHGEDQADDHLHAVRREGEAGAADHGEGAVYRGSPRVDRRHGPLRGVPARRSPADPGHRALPRPHEGREARRPRDADLQQRLDGRAEGGHALHWNITSNCIGAAQFCNISREVRVLGILPFFHSFGFMSTLWLPFLKHFGVTFYPNPLDAKVIGALVERDQVTHLFATPTFLSAYTRRVEPSQFGSLRFVLTGAEKLKDFIATAFQVRFGLVPKEGFGCTECSPAVALNGDDYRQAGIYQVGTRRGTVGQPIPGVTVKIIHLNNGDPVPPGEPGMLLVRGACVMQGYFGMPDKTAEALQDGWYRTGDVAKLEEDGFLIITDRLSRFSKIGGEMVPHVRIEESLQKVTGIEEQVFAVTAVPDDKKGERIAVLYTLPEGKAKEACGLLGSPELNLPALWIPKWADFVKVDAIPALGSGKMDLRAIKQKALEALASNAVGGE
jgi:MFS family permease